MKNEERDKFLTEAMDLCWHEWEGHFSEFKRCLNCGEKDKATNSRLLNNNFSTWEGFGKLFKFCQKQEWWNEFEEKRLITLSCGCTTAIQFEYFINPDNFANAVYEFLKGNVK